MKDVLKVILLKTNFLHNKNTQGIKDLKIAVNSTKLVRTFIKNLKILELLRTCLKLKELELYYIKIKT